MQKICWDVVVVGAGMSGLVAARELTASGLRVVVIDKGRGAGGRMAYRRMGEAIFDHGAQYMSARGDSFKQLMNEWQEQGVACVWSRGFPDLPGDHARWRGAPHMRAIPASLTKGLTVLTDAKVSQVSKNGDEWELSLENGERIISRAVIMTPPVPQSMELIGTIIHELSIDFRKKLEELQYHRCFAVMAVLDGPSGLSSPGVRTFPSGAIAWMADSHLKGISPVPCVTLHASHEFSLSRWDKDRQETAQLLIDQAMLWLSSNVIDFQIHGWRYSKPAKTFHQPFAVLCESPCLAFAGDAFGGPNVEGAALSGLAVAKYLLQK